MVGSGLDPTDQSSVYTTLSGSSQPDNIVLGVDTAWITFTSDGSIVDRGFSIALQNANGKIIFEIILYRHWTPLVHVIVKGQYFHVVYLHIRALVKTHPGQPSDGARPGRVEVSRPMLNSLVVITFIGWALGRAHSDWPSPENICLQSPRVFRSLSTGNSRGSPQGRFSV